MENNDVKNNSPKKFKRILSDVANFIIYDKSGDYALKLNENYNNFDDNTNDTDLIVEFTKTTLNPENNITDANSGKKYKAIKKKYINSKKSDESFVEIFDSVKKEKQNKFENKENIKSKKRIFIESDGNTKTSIPSVSNDTDKDKKERDNIKPEEKEKKRININYIGSVKRMLILIFAAVCGVVTLPFGMNPLGIAIICAADKYIFYIYSGLLISLAFYRENIIIFFGIYTIVAGVKFYLRYSKEKTKVEMLSESISYNNLTKKEKVKILNLIHFNDTGSVIISILVCAVSGCIVGFLKIALKTENIIYTDIAVVMLFMMTSMLFTYLFSGLFDVGTDNKTLEKAGMCSVIFTVIYFLAPIYIYTLSIGYIVSFVLTFIAANSGIDKNNIENKFEKENKNKDIDESENDNDEEIISRFAVNLINHDGVLSDMTRGALVGLLCGVALGDTAGAVTLGICGLVSGLFFSQSTVLAIISGIISAASYSVYVAGIDAVQRYIPNMLAGLTFYMPVSMFYSSVMKKIQAGKYNKKSAPLLDRGLLITELPANKLNNLSDAFQGLSGIFYEISERFKTPNSNEIKAIVSACVEKTCEKCENNNSCLLNDRQIINNMQKKCADYLSKNGRLNSIGISNIFIENCVKISDIQNKINAVYCSKTEENIENDKTKIFADNYENIAKLLQNNIKLGKEDIAFKKDMSEKIFLCLENMGIECENVIVMGERKKTVYIFGVKMVNYSGAISDITNMLERICGTWFECPEYILRDNYIIMKNQSRNKFKIYSVQMSKTAGEFELNQTSDNLVVGDGDLDIPKNKNEIENINNNNINGDSVSIFNGKDGYYYGLISDGMGSGKNAALSSRLTVLLIEKLLSAGNQKDLTVEMLNSLLISKNDECFASVDLFEADLITGQAIFIKAGAAPSFIVRNGKLFKIQSSTVPAGIIKNINSEQTKFEIEDGDYILMLSDGIISTFEEGAWLIEMLGIEKNLKDPKILLNNILSEAYKKNKRKDDMTVLFMKITEERIVV